MSSAKQSPFNGQETDLKKIENKLSCGKLLATKKQSALLHAGQTNICTIN
jgi:hypothetical protein